jgi:hypothetical protein
MELVSEQGTNVQGTDELNMARWKLVKDQLSQYELRQRGDSPGRNHRTKRGASGKAEPVQFNWRRNWSRKVAPYLNEKLVQASLNFGMSLNDRTWKPGDAPCDYGALGFNRIVKGKLSWYQPLGRCHHIACFSMAVGVLNYPDLDWRFVSGPLHTVSAGYDAEGNPRVVMDILQFSRFTAEASLAYSEITDPRTSADEDWDVVFRYFVARMVPRLKARARELGGNGTKRESLQPTTSNGDSSRRKEDDYLRQQEAQDLRGCPDGGRPNPGPLTLPPQ